MANPTLTEYHNIAMKNPSAPGPARWWRVITVGPRGETAPDVLPARFTLDPEVPAQMLPPLNKAGPNGELILHSLRFWICIQTGSVVFGNPLPGGPAKVNMRPWTMLCRNYHAL